MGTLQVILFLLLAALGIALIGGWIWLQNQRRTKCSWLNLRTCARRGHSYDLFGFRVENGGHMTIHGKCMRCDAPSPEFSRLIERNRAKCKPSGRSTSQTHGIQFGNVLTSARYAAMNALPTLANVFPDVIAVTSLKLESKWERLFVAAVFGLIGAELIGEGLAQGTDRRQEVWEEAKAALDSWDSDAFADVRTFVHYLNEVAEGEYAPAQWAGCIGFWLWHQLCPSDNKTGTANMELEPLLAVGFASVGRKHPDDARCIAATGKLIFACSDAELSWMPGRRERMRGGGGKRESLMQLHRLNPN